MVSRNDPCWCGSGKKWKKCHYPESSPKNLSISDDYNKRYGILIKKPKEIEGIRKSCTLCAFVLDELCKASKEGVTTNDLNALSEKLIKEAGASAAPLGYGDPPFPKSICTSLNNVICHGIPDDIPLKDGDIMNIDVSTILDGYYGDCSRMVTIGKIDAERQKVVDVSYRCMMAGIEICKPGTLISDIGNTISDIAEKEGCSVVYQFVGHGVGLDFHEPPQVPFHRNRLHIPIVEGMTFTIEPMINAGVADGEIDPTNGWTTYTKDRKASAQWEHTILITENSYEILTPFP